MLVSRNTEQLDSSEQKQASDIWAFPPNPKREEKSIYVNL